MIRIIEDFEEQKDRSYLGLGDLYIFDPKTAESARQNAGGDDEPRSILKADESVLRTVYRSTVLQQRKAKECCLNNRNGQLTVD